jgi:hypothetical protein
MGTSGIGGAGHYFNRAWAREFCSLNERYCNPPNRTDDKQQTTDIGGWISSAPSLWCGKDEMLIHFIDSSDGGLRNCHQTFASGKGSGQGFTFVDLRSRGGASLFLSPGTVAATSLRDGFDLGMLRNSPDMFVSKFISPVLHVSLKHFDESARYLYNVFYMRRVDLIFLC